MSVQEHYLLTNCIVEKSGSHLIIRDSKVTELIKAAQLFQEHGTTEFVLGEKGGDRAWLVKLFAERDNAITACQQDAKTKDESLTVMIELTVIQ